MGRTTIGAPTLTKLKELATKLHLRPNPLLSYFIVENVSAASESTVPTMETYSDIPLEYILSVTISKRASTIVKDLYSLYGSSRCRVHAITSFLAEDALATYAYTPERFPGVKHLPQQGVHSYRKNTSVGIAKAVYERLKWQQERSVAEQPEERPSISALVEGILRTVPRQRLFADLGNAQKVQIALGSLPIREYVAVVLTPGSYEFISFLAAETGAPKSRILTYIIAEELRAVEDTLVVDGGLLPDDIRERYTELLGQLLAIGEEENY
jgi:hypothetical protein